MTRVLLALLLSLPMASSLAQEAPVATLPVSSASATTPANPDIDAAVGKYVLFAVLVADQPTFRQSWHDRLRLNQMLKGKEKEKNKGKNAMESAVEVGMALAMDRIGPYLMRSSDAATNEFLAVFGGLFRTASENAAVCSLLLPGESGSRPATKETTETEAMLEETLLEPLLLALGTVAQTGRDGEERTLEESTVREAVVPMLLSMGDKHGEDAIRTFTRVGDKSIDASKRCQAMGWFFEEVLARPESERAMLIRAIWTLGSAKRL